ncbi:MAG TPA: peptidylprolyl isomerase [Myxococcales bacterium]|nr:peptidylprolyl isomerase [Myxococcales bacterium]
MIWPLLLLAAAPAAAPTGVLLDRVAAVVDDSPILLSEVEDRAAPELRRLADEDVDAAEVAHRRRDMLRQSLQTLIDERLLEEQLKSANISVTDEDLQTSIADVMRLNGISDPKQFETALEHEGMTMESYRSSLRRQLEKMKLLSLRVHPQVKVTDTELEDEYQKEYLATGGEEEVRARHILVKLPKDASPADRAKALAKARELHQKLLAGEDFAEVARKYSDGPSAADGGELGWFKRGVMVPEFEAAAFALPKGGVSDPVLTHFGYHIIQVEDRRRTAPPPLDKVKDRLRQKLTQRQTERLTADYLSSLRKDASIEIKMDELKPATP